MFTNISRLIKCNVTRNVRHKKKRRLSGPTGTSLSLGPDRRYHG